MSYSEGNGKTPGIDNTACTSHNYPSPPPYPGPPPTGFGDHPVVHQPQHGPTYQHVQTTTVISGPNVTYVTSSGPGVVQGAVTTVVVPGMGTSPTAMTCRTCGMQIVTKVRNKPSTRTHICAAFLCVIGFWPCVCIPYYVDMFASAEHYCPNCNAFIGKTLD